MKTEKYGLEYHIAVRDSDKSKEKIESFTQKLIQLDQQIKECTESFKALKEAIDAL